MNPRQIATAVVWLAILGLVVLVAARVVSTTGKRAASTL